MQKHFKQFHSCPKCGGAIDGEKQEFFICPECENAICLKVELKWHPFKYCGNCGTNLASAKIRAMALAMEDVKLNRLWSSSK